VAFTNEQHRQRYADDEKHRARKLAANKVWRTEHTKELNAAWSDSEAQIVPARTSPRIARRRRA
jgi:hypothetical protein